MADVATAAVVSKQEERALLKEGAQKWSKAEVVALKEYCCPKDSTASEILAFWYVCKRTGLDPFMRQIYLVRYGSSDEESEGRGRCVIQVGIDGFRQVSMDVEGFAGIGRPKFEGESSSDGLNEIYEPFTVKHPLLCEIEVFRYLHGERIPFIGIARWREFAKYVKDRKSGKLRLNAMWSKMPHNQLAKCAEAQAHRKSAPMRLSGVYAPEEIGTVIDVVGTPVGGAMAQPQARPAISQQGVASTDEKPSKVLWNRLMQMAGGDSEAAATELYRLTSFIGKDGKTVGVRDWSKLSDPWARKTLAKLDAEEPSFG